MWKTSKTKQEAGFDAAVAFSGGAASFVGLLALSGWITGLRALASIRSDYIPMSPDTAMAFVFLGLILFLHVRIQEHGGSKLFVSAIIAFVSIYGLLKFIEYFVNADLTFENILFPATEKFGSFFIKRMSPVTGVLFFLSGFALQLKLLLGTRHKIPNMISSLGVVTLTVGFVATVGYVFGTPLLYGGDIIPLAATTAIGFLLLGFGLVAVAGPENIFVRPFVGDSASARLLRIFLPMTISAVLVQGFLSETFIHAYGVNYALVTALLSLGFAVLMSAVVVQLSQVIFRRGDVAEAVRKQSEERYRQLFENSPIGIYRTTPDGHILASNPALVRMLGYSLFEEFAERNLEQEPDASYLRRDFKEQLEREGRITGLEAVWNKRDGTSLSIRENAQAVRDENGSVLYYDGTVEDITERKRADEAIRKSEQEFRLVWENSADGMRLTNEEGRVVLVNEAFCRIVGKGRSELEGKSLAVIYGKERQEHVPRRHKERFKSRTVETHFDREITLWNGRKIWIEVTNSFLEFEGQPPLLLGIFRDITERKQVEEALRKQHSALQGILGSANASIFSVDKEYKYTMFNSRHVATMEAFYGATVEMGRSILDYMTVKVDRATAKQNIDRALAGESHVHSAYSGEEARSRRYIEVSHNPIRSEDGTVIGVAVLSHDITERKKAEDNLVASEKRFRSIWDNSADGMRLTNSEGRIIEVNEAYCRMVNITRDNLIGQFFSVVYKRGGMDDDLNLYVERFRSGKVGPQVSTTATLWDGRPIDLEISSSFIGLTGHDKMLLSIFRDITERKRTEEELKKSHEKFRELFDNAPVGYHELDATGTITNVNLTELQMLGFTLEEMVGRPVWEFVGGGELSRKRVLDKLAGVVPPNNNAERMYRRKDGTTIPVLIDESLLRNQRGEVSGIRTVIQDITEKKRAEGALRQLEEKYRSLFEESKDVIYISTPKGKLLDINPAGVDLLGYNSKEEMLQIEIAHDLFVDPRQREVLQQLMEDKGFIRNYEEVLRRKDGKKINVLDTATAVRDAKGRTILFRGIMRDVTKEKQLEEELTQIQKLESIGTLASGIAHDFNNILGIILGYSSLMERTGGDPQSLSQSAQAINKAVQRGANLVSQILTFARKTDVLVGPVDLNVMVKELFKMLKETFPKKIELSLQLSKDIQFINADATQVHQVLLNLSVNSRDAMSSGGTLTFKTEVVKGSNLRNIFSNTSDGDYVHLSVSDTGIGMDEKTRSQIFDPFFTTKEKGKGTGLGLSVVYGVIKNHNGFVNVESEPGKGSTFNLYFPISAESLRATGKEAEDREEVRGGTETILVVEDEEALLTMLKVILEVKGYRVIAAVDGLEALELFRKHKDEIALVMTDVGLPKISGDQLFFELKKVNPSVRVVLMSGYIDARLKSEIFRAGVHDFVQKPYEPNEVLKKVRESIDRK